MTLEFRSLRENELPQWFEHVSGIFRKTPRSYFERHWYADPWRDLEGIRVAMDAGRIVGTVRAFRRYVYLGGDAIPMGGIGEVSTRPDYRGQGVSYRLLEDALRTMEAWGTAVSMLFASRHGHYARHGWSLVRNPLRSLIVRPKKAEAEDGIRPLDLAAEGDLKQVSQLYARFSRSMEGPVVRRNDDCYWHRWVAEEWGQGFGLFRDGRLVGYVALKQQSDGRLFLQEFAFDPVCPAGGPSMADMPAVLLEQAVAGFGPLARQVVFPTILDPDNLLGADQAPILEDWMVKVVRPEILSPSATAVIQALLAEKAAAPPRFWFWPTDWF